MANQQVSTYQIGGSSYPRIRYGDEPNWSSFDGPCPDCDVEKGSYHLPGCDIERCPRCHGQAIGCDCND